MTANTPDSPKEEPAPKPYEPPRLEVYGGIQQLTKMQGAVGNADGGGGGSNKTSMV